MRVLIKIFLAFFLGENKHCGQQMYHRLVISFLLLFLFFHFSCVSLEKREAENFFSQENLEGETFRVFIAKDIYLVKQMKDDDRIRRKEDPNGDEEKRLFFTQEHDRINFKKIILEGSLFLDFNSSLKTVSIQYESGKNPITWQASKHFIKDLSRFSFEKMENWDSLLQIKVKYMWYILPAPFLSDAERKEKAIQYLRSQKQGE